ncbi:hypothetical protein [Sphingomonas suaedae]|uniref:hypothetical protein n=1 Tax=Sphingomonas suaedae TaxID=2599297 RepID=UPI001C944A88|nr:hypothetical protein [Sphingomonas suaedae]
MKAFQTSTRPQSVAMPRVSRRVLLGLVAGCAAGALSSCSGGGQSGGNAGGGVIVAPTPTPTPAPSPSPSPTPTPTGAVDFGGAIGANFNEHYDDIDYDEMREANAKWLRIFVGPALPTRDAALNATLAANSNGFKTVLSIKWSFLDRDFPRPDTANMQRELDRLDVILQRVMGKVDILVIGNEPYIDTLTQQQDDDLNVFYETMAARAIAYRAQSCGDTCNTRLYMGALNRLDLASNITPSVERWMQYVKATPEIDGVDIHPHVPAIEASKAFLDYILPRMRPDQRFIATEFSLVHWWRENSTKAISAGFADKYGLPRTTQNWQVIRSAVDNPFAKAKWDEFLSMSPWFENRKRFLANQMKIFRDTKQLAVATYAFKQSPEMGVDYGPDKPTWILNGVYAPITVQRRPNGKADFNYAWIDDFRVLAQTP